MVAFSVSTLKANSITKKKKSGKGEDNFTFKQTRLKKEFQSKKEFFEALLLLVINRTYCIGLAASASPLEELLTGHL